jgi:hypothetical protein
MSSDISDDNDVPFIEWAAVQEVTATELSAVERIGPLTRLIFTIPVRLDPGRDRQSRVVVAKLLLPTEMIPAIIAQMTASVEPAPRSADEVTLQ